MSNKSSISSLSIYRAIAMMAVLCIHATSQTIKATQTTDSFVVYNFLNVFSKFAVPAFLLLTSFVMFYNYCDKGLTSWSSLKEFYTKRLKLILLPYVICSTCYFLLNHWLAYRSRGLGDTLQAYVVSLIKGTAYTHLYYVIILIQFYLIFPVILYFFRSVKSAIWAIPIGIALHWGFVIWNKLDLHIVYKGSLLVSYSIYIMVGAFIGVYWNRIQGWFNALTPEGIRRDRWITALVWLVWIAASLGHVQLWYATYKYGMRFNTLWYEAAWNAHALLSCVVLIQLSQYIERKFPERFVKLITRFGDVSFGIYLIHPVILYLYRKIPLGGGDSISYALYIGGGFLCAFLLSWAIVELCHRYIPFSWMFFGAVPKKRSGNVQRQNQPTQTTVQPPN
ncbi:acyltransferase [Paenibacillus alvei]|uniref:acyltransferase n=1 Tax=Paenibacillus TaxID=44249 RepID=UPI00227E7D3A|nr:acyltransferase [Paenibacillus alvei]